MVSSLYPHTPTRTPPHKLPSWTTSETFPESLGSPALGCRDSIDDRIRRACQAAVSIEEEQNHTGLAEGVQLSVKIGIGVGDVSVLYIGGFSGRIETAVVGGPLVQAFESERHGVSDGQVIVSREVWGHVQRYYEGLVIKKEFRDEPGPMEDMGEGFKLIHQRGWETQRALLENKKVRELRRKRSHRCPPCRKSARFHGYPASLQDDQKASDRL